MRHQPGRGDLLHHVAPASAALDRQLDGAWVSWFNTERIHSELGDATPAEVEAAWAVESARAA